MTPISNVCQTLLDNDSATEHGKRPFYHTYRSDPESWMIDHISRARWLTCYCIPSPCRFNTYWTHCCDLCIYHYPLRCWSLTLTYLTFSSLESYEIQNGRFTHRKCREFFSLISGPIHHTGCEAQRQAKRNLLLRMSVHTGRKQHKRNCPQIACSRPVWIETCAWQFSKRQASLTLQWAFSPVLRLATKIDESVVANERWHQTCTLYNVQLWNATKQSKWQCGSLTRFGTSTKSARSYTAYIPLTWEVFFPSFFSYLSDSFLPSFLNTYSSQDFLILAQVQKLSHPFCILIPHSYLTHIRIHKHTNSTNESSTCILVLEPISRQIQA